MHLLAGTVIHTFEASNISDIESLPIHLAPHINEARLNRATCIWLVWRGCFCIISTRYKSLVESSPSCRLIHHNLQGLITYYVVYNFTLEVKRITFESKTAFETFSTIA